MTNPRTVTFEAWAVTAGPASTFGLVTSDHVPWLIERKDDADCEAREQGYPSKVVRVRVTVEPIGEDGA